MSSSIFMPYGQFMVATSAYASASEAFAFSTS